jgi:hypothetical protein
MTRDDDTRDDHPPSGIAINETPETIDTARDEEVDVELRQREGRFSEGQEEESDTAEKEVERRFSEGQERHPFSE